MINYVQFMNDEKKEKFSPKKLRKEKLSNAKEENRQTNYNRFIELDFVESITCEFFDIISIYHIKKYIMFNDKVSVYYNGKFIDKRVIKRIGKAILNKIETKSFINNEKIFKQGELWVDEFEENEIKSPLIK